MTTTADLRRRPSRTLLDLTVLRPNAALFTCHGCGQLTRPARRADIAGHSYFRCDACTALNRQTAPGKR